MLFSDKKKRTRINNIFPSTAGCVISNQRLSLWRKMNWQNLKRKLVAEAEYIHLGEVKNEEDKLEEKKVKLSQDAQENES